MTEEYLHILHSGNNYKCITNFIPQNFLRNPLYIITQTTANPHVSEILGTVWFVKM